MMQNVHVSDQYAINSVTEKATIADTDIPVMESALQHANMKKLAVRTADTHGVQLTEKSISGLLVLRTGSEHKALESALKSVLQIMLPDVLSTTMANAAGATHCLRWMAPDEWLLSCPLSEAFNIEKSLRNSLGDKSVAIVNVSGGYTSLILQGSHANDVLKKSTGYDVHPTNFMPGKVVNTVFAKAQVTLRCIDTNQYELIVRRSFADYVWHWIQVASVEYGLGIDVES